MSARQTPRIIAKLYWHLKRFANHSSCVVITIVLGALASGCASPPLYNWDSYEGSMQASYITHNEEQALANLEATIVSAEQSGRRTPPGVYAECGFLVYKRGNSELAIKYFQREAQLFPESKLLMDKLVAKIHKQTPVETQSPPEGEAIQ